ncbi:MAG: TRAP transporter TatT component family protein [Pseudomonadota bacterium]|nr:TRAP transporter TatT component family protein [Pseudomonadota bacterium]
MIRLSLLLFAFLTLSACNTLVSSATKDLADNLSQAIQNQNDPDTVRQGAPAYLIMIDSFIQGSPDDVDLLIAGSNLYGSYAGAFITKPARAMRLTEKSRQYALHAFCIQLPEFCDIQGKHFPEFEKALQKINKSNLPVLNTWGIAWAGWIQTRTEDWTAIADIPKIKAIMLRVVELDPAWDNGNAQLYLGVLNAFLPAAMGGKPELAKEYFEQAIRHSDRKNLMVKTLYAQYYARIVFDKQLHDKLLNEVLQAPVSSPGMTLVNTLAREQAQQLLDESDDFF